MTIIATRSAPMSRSGRSSPNTVKVRTLVAPLAAILTLLLANVVYGATQPMASLFFAGCLILCALVSIILSGPRNATIAMALTPALILLLTSLGAFGSLRSAAPDAAVLLAMTSAWTIGYLAARHRTTLDMVWSALVWSMLLYTIWVFFTHIGVSLDSAMGANLTAGLGAPSEAAILFGFFALVGSARLMHVIKQMDARALSRSEMVDCLLRDGLGGMLLLGFALTCLAMTGSRVGLLFTAAVLIFHSWWDLRAILTRDHRSRWLQVLERLTPVASVVAVGLGFFVAFFRDESVILNAAGAPPNTHAQRLQVYLDAFMDKPFLGHGLGQIEPLTHQITTLHSYVALSAHGDAQNVVLNWLVETGVTGLILAAMVLAAAYFMLARSFRARGTPRSMSRLAIMAGAYLLLHGLADSSLALPGLNWAFALLLGCACGVAALNAAKQPSSLQ